MIYLTRRATFSSSHYYWSDAWTAEKNEQVFGRCSSRAGSGGAGWSPFLGRPRLRLGWTGAAAAGALSGFSQASISVESREMWPAKRSFCVASISAACRRCGNSEAAKPAKARAAARSCKAGPRRRAKGQP